jgi:hypothetical protein
VFAFPARSLSWEFKRGHDSGVHPAIYWAVNFQFRIGISAILWALAFLGFTVVYSPMLVRRSL